MPMAILRVVGAGPSVTFQDGGRAGGLRFGVPRSGPVDRFGHALANVAVGSSPDATAIEISAAGLELVTGAAMTFGFAGASVDVDGGRVRDGDGVVTVGRSARLRIVPARGRRWAHLAVAGVFRVPTWMGSTATHASSGLGGGALNAGDEIVVDRVALRADLDGPLPHRRSAGDRPLELRVVLGPQDEAFVPAALASLVEAPFAVTAAADRMGMRLDGPALELADALTLPSEPIVRGAIQVDGAGVPTVLLADHQTTGGYPKIATVVLTDTDVLAQAPTGVAIRFRVVTPAAAVELVRAETARRSALLVGLAAPDRTLAQRLAVRNLIAGAEPELVDDPDGV